MKLTGSLFFQIRFCREETGFLFGRVSALYKGHGLLHFPAEKAVVCTGFAVRADLGRILHKDQGWPISGGRSVNGLRDWGVCLRLLR